MAVTDARVKFLRGQLANLPSTKVDGNVYVATDERSMYVDYKDGSGTLQRIRLGDFLEFANWAAIENQAGSGYSTTALYYAEQENILGKWTGTQWKQINAQKTLEQMLSSMSYNVTTGGGTTATIKLRVTGTDNIDKWASNLTYKIASLDSDSLKITSSTDASGFTNINLRAKDAVLKHEMEVNTRTYDQNDATLSLYSYEYGTNSSGTALTKPSSWGNDNLMSAITFSGNGQTHVSSNASTGVISISTNLGYGMAFNSSGVLTLTVTDLNSNTPKTATVTPTIRIGKTGATADYKFESGIASLPVYTISQADTAIENAMKSANAMTYKGTLGATADSATVNTLPLSANSVKIGDTYKVVTAGAYAADTQSPPTTYNTTVGDMFIATSTDGTENSAGYIDVAKIRWTYIPSGNEDIISNTIVYTAASKKFILSSGGVQSGAAWAIGSGLDVTSSGSGSNQLVTIKHADITTSATTADTTTNAEVGTTTVPFSTSGIEFTAITGLSLSNGHITGIKTGTFKVGMQKVTPSLNGRLINSSGTLITPSSSASSSRANFQSIITYFDGTSSTSTSDIKLSSDTLTFRKASASADLQVDLLWESF